MAFIVRLHRNIGKLLVFFLLSTVLTSCGAPKDIQNISVELNTEFSGELEDVQVEDLFLTWNSKKLGSDERFEVVMDFSNVIGEEYTVEYLIEESELDLQVDGQKHKWRLAASWNEKATLFPLFAEAKSGAEIPISISHIEGRNKVISQTQFTWVRPARVRAPQAPILSVKWQDSGDNFYRWSLQGDFNLTFDSYPDSYNLDCTPKEICEGGLRTRFPLAYNNFAFAAIPQDHEIDGYNVNGKGKKLSFSFEAINEIGSGGIVKVETTSGGPTQSITSPQRQPNPFDRTWKSSERDIESLAKTVWCIESGFRNYIWSKDICTNELSR
jgi:hypothetical protein